MGGQGSGRKPDEAKRFIETHANVAAAGKEGLVIPNYSGIRDDINKGRVGKKLGSPTNAPTDLTLGSNQPIAVATQVGEDIQISDKIQLVEFTWTYTDGTLPAEGFELKYTDDSGFENLVYLSSDTRKAFVVFDATTFTAFIRAFRIDADGTQFTSAADLEGGITPDTISTPISPFQRVGTDITTVNSGDDVTLSGALTVSGAVTGDSTLTILDANTTYSQSLSAITFNPTITNDLNNASTIGVNLAPTLSVDQAAQVIPFAGVAVQPTVKNPSSASTFLGSNISLLSAQTHTGDTNSIQTNNTGVLHQPVFNIANGGDLQVNADTAFLSGNCTTVDGSNIVNKYGFFMTNPTLLFADSNLTNLYGAYIEDMTSCTNGYGVVIEGAKTNALWLASGGDTTTESGGVVFGASKDTNLYRSAADTLKTDDGFVANSLTLTTDLAVAHGGTAASNAGDARTNLGVVIGTDVQAFDANNATASSTTTFTNKTIDANGTGNSISNIDVADLSNGTDGELITWDSSGVPATVGVGTATHVLTSNGAGAAPTFQAAGGDNTSVVFGTSETNRASTHYHGLGGANSSSLINVENVRIPVAGVLSDLYVRCDTQPGTGSDAWACQYFVNGSLKSGGSDPIATITSANKNAADTSNTLTVSAGDHVAVRFLEFGTCASAATGWSAVFTPS